jgi:hypothetical protein
MNRISPETAGTLAREIIRTRPDDFDQRQYPEARNAVLVRRIGSGFYGWAFELKTPPIAQPNVAAVCRWWWVVVRASGRTPAVMGSWAGYPPKGFSERFTRASDLELIAYMGSLSGEATDGR